MDEMIDAFHRDGLRAATDVYLRATRRGPLSRAGARIVESVLPVTELCTALLRYDAAIGTWGVGPGSRAMLEEWDLQPRCELHPDTWRVLDHEPFLAFGNHACGLEPALFNALLTRTDIHYLAGDFVARVGPNLARVVLPLARPDSPAPTPAGLRARALDAVERALWPARDDFAARRANAAQLARAGRLIGSGGAGVHVFPSGSLHPGAPWQPGIGHLVRSLARARGTQSSTRPIHLIPMVYGVRDAHLLAARVLGAHPGMRAAARLRLAVRDPGPYVYADAPVPLDVFLPPGDPLPPPAVLAERLRELWLRARAGADRAIPGWRSAGSVLGPRRLP